MFEAGAVPGQDGSGRSPDGEGLAAAPHEESQSEHQLDPARCLRGTDPPGLTQPLPGASGLAPQLTKVGISDDSSPLSLLIWRASHRVTQTSK